MRAQLDVRHGLLLLAQTGAEGIVTERATGGPGATGSSQSITLCRPNRGKQRQPARKGKKKPALETRRAPWPYPDAATRSIPPLPTPWKAVRRSIDKSRSGP